MSPKEERMRDANDSFFGLLLLSFLAAYAPALFWVLWLDSAADSVLPQSNQEFAFGRVSGNTLPEVHA
jgi:hypothetical protein